MDLTKVWNRNPNGNLRQILASKQKGSRVQRNKILQEPDLKSVEDGALLNPLILKKILGYLDNAGDLLNCRLVCTDWKSLATEILLKRRSVKISLAFDEKTGAFFKTRSKSPHFSVDFISSPQFDQPSRYLQKFPLKNLLRLIKSSGVGKIPPPSPFPCVSFQIVAGDLESDDLSSFLHFYGENVQKLGLTFCHYKKKKRLRLPLNSERVFTKVSSVRNLLCRQLPNLKELEIFNMTDYQFYDLLGRESFAFHNLFEEFEFEMESTGTETRISTALSPGNQKEANRMMMIARLPKLEKLCCSIFKFHGFHTLYSEDEDGKSVILKNMMESKSVEFHGFSDVNSACKDCVKALIAKNNVCELENLSIKDLGLDLMEKVLEKYPAQLQFDELYIDFDVETLEQLMSSWMMKKRMIRVLNTTFKCATTNSNAKKNRVQFGRPIGFLSNLDSGLDFKIPLMENVSHLILSKLQKDDERELEFRAEENGQMLNLANIPFPFFPCGFTLSDTFPNLRNVWLLDWTRDIFSDLLGSNYQVLPTVKDFYLKWASFEPLKGFSKLPQVFSHLTKIKIENINNFGAVAPFLWKFKKLEDLMIGLDVGSSALENSNSNKMGAVDSAITGFSMETCQQLWEPEELLNWARRAAKSNAERIHEEMSGKNVHPADSGFSAWSGSGVESISFESLRVNASICDLPNVDLFQKESYFLISELSWLFAFDLMPHLEVNMIPAAAIYQNDMRMGEHFEKLYKVLDWLKENKRV